MSVLRACCFLIALLIIGSPALAQDSESQTDASGDGQPARKQYQVEVITFQYLGPDSAGGETFDRLLVEQYLPSSPFDIDRYNRLRKVVSYTEVTHLAGALERLRQSPQYSVMTRSAWIQPLLSRSEAVNVPLGDRDAGGGYQGDFSGSGRTQVSGSLSVYGGHLLFVDLEMRAALPGRSPAGGGAAQYSGSSSTNTGDVSRTASGQSPAVFRISERRRIKLEEFHYFDHPYIGAIVSVTRYSGEASGG